MTQFLYFSLIGLSLPLLTATAAQANIVAINCPQPDALVFEKNSHGSYDVAADSVVTSRNNEPTFTLVGTTNANRALALTDTFYDRDYLRCTYRGLIGDEATTEVIIEKAKATSYPTLSYCYFVNEPGTKSCSNLTITDQSRDCTLRCESL